MKKFRDYFAEGATALPSFSLKEADLLGASSSVASMNAGESPLVNPSREAQAGGGDPPEPRAQPIGSGREPDAMDTQLRQAQTMATELLKSLTTLPQPWNRGFSPYIRVLKVLVNKIGELS